MTTQVNLSYYEDENEDNFGSTIKELPNHFRNEESLPAICSGEALEIAKNVLSETVIEKLKDIQWQSFQYKVRLYLAKHSRDLEKPTPNFLATFNLVHFAILVQNPQLLQFLIKQDSWNIFCDCLQFSSQTNVKVKDESELVIREESWIFEASCAHLAARFFPQGLDLILSDENICKAVINCKAGPREMSPIHVAALSTKSLSVQ